jgi:hypothetical protein
MPVSLSTGAMQNCRSNLLDASRDHVAQLSLVLIHPTLRVLMSALASVRHPWLQMPKMKRKAEHAPDEPLADKRRRMHALERGLADMSLIPGQAPTKAHTAARSLAAHAADADETMDDAEAKSAGPTPGAVHSIAEPKDARMSRSTWYEPEKDREFARL